MNRERGKEKKGKIEREREIETLDFRKDAILK